MSATTIFDGPVIGLADEYRDTLKALLLSLYRKRAKNELRVSYYKGHQKLRDLGIAVPPTLRTLDVVVGWPAKAVDSMSRRTILNGFVSAGGSELNAVLDDVWEGNRLASEAPAAHTSALVYSCSFVFVTKGAPGEPDVLVTTRSAEDATGIWDGRRRALSSALAVVDYDSTSGVPSLLNLYVPGKVITLERYESGYQVVSEVAHGMGVPVEVLPYRATHDLPFGRSRITRGVRYLTDAAARTMLRTEVGAEFYNAPQRYILGADESAFVDASGSPVPAWSVMLGRMLALNRDENGDVPTVGSFAQQTMQPNLDQLKSLAQMFAAETSIPVGALGIVQDNPSSAEAIRAVNEEQGIEIEHWQRTSLAPVWKRVMRRAVGMVSDSPAALAEAHTVAPDWGSWALASENAMADAAVKQVTAVPWLAESEVLLRRMGYKPDEIQQLLADKQRVEASSRVHQLIEAARAVTDGDNSAGSGVPVSESVASDASAA